jgi:hypothetical protein
VQGARADASMTMHRNDVRTRMRMTSAPKQCSKLVQK